MIVWERRYKDEPHEYDWYFSSSDLASMLEPISSLDAEILYLGCGTSTLGEELYKRNRKFVTNVDTSKNAIKLMKQKYSHRQEMEFVEMDALKLPKELSQAFDLVVDKALLDSFLCETNNKETILRYLREVKRVLKPRGFFCLVSHGLPETRLPLIQAAFELSSSSKVKIITIPKPKVEGFEDGESSNFYLYRLQVD